jgi:hypothetical protein
MGKSTTAAVALFVSTLANVALLEDPLLDPYT